jgi:hypothetical protein
LGAGFSALRKLTPAQADELKKKPVRLWPPKIRRFVRWIQIIYRNARPILEGPPKKADTNEPEGRLLCWFDSAPEEERMRCFVMMRTIVLCWVITGSYPSQLLRRIRLYGDLRALEDLLRIDRRLFYDAGIQIRMRRELGNPKSAFVRIALRAMKAKAPAIKRATLKARFAAIIQSVVGEDSPLFSEPEIRRIYDAIVEAQTGGRERIDTSLPETPEALRKAIARERAKFVAPSRQAAGQK